MSLDSLCWSHSCVRGVHLSAAPMHASPLDWQIIFSLISLASVVTESGPLTLHRWLRWTLVISALCWAAIALREMGFYIELRASSGASAPSASWNVWESAEDARLA